MVKMLESAEEFKTTISGDKPVRTPAPRAPRESTDRRAFDVVNSESEPGARGVVLGFADPASPSRSRDPLRTTPGAHVAAHG